MRRLVLVSALALAACDDATPPKGDPAITPITSAGPVLTTSAAPSSPRTPAPVAPAKVAPARTPAAPSAEASAAPSAEASAVPSAEGQATLLGTITRARKVKVTQRTDVEVETEIADADALATLLSAIGMTQALEDGCPSCVPAVRFAFSDAFGTRLGTIGWRCGDDEKVAIVRDALANECKKIEVADGAALARLVAELFPKPEEPEPKR